MRSILAPFLLALSLGLVAPETRAATPAGEAQFEFWLGSTEPGADFLDADVSGGIRFGGNRNDRLTVVGEIGYAQADGRLEGRSVHWKNTAFDLAFEFNFATRKRVVPALLAGVGYSFPTSDGSIPPAYRDGLTAESFTLQVGAGLKIDLVRNMYLHPAARARWYFERTSDSVDRELLLALGWRFGGPARAASRQP